MKRLTLLIVPSKGARTLILLSAEMAAPPPSKATANAASLHSIFETFPNPTSDFVTL